MALHIETEAVHGFLIHNQSLLAFEEAVVHRMRTDLRAMLTLTEAKLVNVLLIVGIIFILDNLNRKRFYINK